MDMPTVNQLITWSLFGLFWIIAFLIMRAIVLWYWKLDKIVSLLQKIEKHLSKMK
jgi:TM2 domain-containing membrane protein YozV